VVRTFVFVLTFILWPQRLIEKLRTVAELLAVARNLART